MKIIVAFNDLLLTFYQFKAATLSQRYSIFRNITLNGAEKTRNNTCSISFSPTFRVISRKIELLLGQCIVLTVAIIVFNLVC